MSKPKLNLLTGDDKTVLENFRRIAKVWDDDPILRGQWKFIELSFDAAVTNFKYTHHLKFIPKDVITTSIIGTGTVTWNYSLFDRDFLDLTVSAACTIRALIGRHEEGEV